MLNTTKIMRLSLLLLLAMSITACGFHLRGSSPLFEGAYGVYVSAPKGSFTDELNDALARSGARVANVAEGSDIVIDVARAHKKREVGTLDERGKVDSYRINFTVVYSVVSADGKLLGGPEVLSENRQYVFEPEDVVESEFEEQALVQNMEQSIASKIVRRVSSLSQTN